MSTKENVFISGEAYVLIPFAGQFRTKFTVTNGVFVYSDSDKSFDAKLAQVGGTNITRNSPTLSELKCYLEEGDKYVSFAKAALQKLQNLVINNKHNKVIYSSNLTDSEAFVVIVFT